MAPTSRAMAAPRPRDAPVMRTVRLEFAVFMSLPCDLMVRELRYLGAIARGHAAHRSLCSRPCASSISSMDGTPIEERHGWLLSPVSTQRARVVLLAAEAPAH